MKDLTGVIHIFCNMMDEWVMCVYAFANIQQIAAIKI